MLQDNLLFSVIIMIYVLLDDKKRNHYTKTYYQHDKELFEKMNKDWRWVYAAVNSFAATEEEMRVSNVKTKRNIQFLKKLNYIFADLDIAKSWDNMTRELKEEKKQKLIDAVMEELKPTKIIITSNWIQPLRKINEESITVETQNKYTEIINRIIERSKAHGWAGDKVKDVTRILRVPWYYHMKEEPYMVTVQKISDTSYCLDDFIGKFGIDVIIPQPVYEVKRDIPTTQVFQEIESLDFRDVVIRAFAGIGRSCEFDKQDRLIIDWRLTGTFKSKKWDFLASTSHEPFRWNRITSVAEIMNMSYTEAYRRICDTYNIKTETQLRKEKKTIEKWKEMQHKIETSFRHITQEEKYMMWLDELLQREPTQITKRWMDEFDWLLWWLYEGRIYLVWAETWVWKSTFVNQVANNVASTGKRVVKYSLEDRMEDKAQEDIFYAINKKRNKDWKWLLDPIIFTNWWYNKTSRFLDECVEAKENLSRLPIIELKRDKTITPSELVELIKIEADNWTKLFIIDHLHFLDFKWDNESRIDQQIADTMQQLNMVVTSRNITILLVAHYKVWVSKQWEPSYDRFRWSSAIKQTVNIIIQIQENWDDRIFYVTKLRWLRWLWRDKIVYSRFDTMLWEFTFTKTEEQKQKENTFFN